MAEGGWFGLPRPSPAAVPPRPAARRPLRGRSPPGPESQRDAPAARGETNGSSRSRLVVRFDCVTALEYLLKKGKGEQSVGARARVAGPRAELRPAQGPALTALSGASGLLAAARSARLRPSRGLALHTAVFSREIIYKLCSVLRSLGRRGRARMALNVITISFVGWIE